MLNHCCEGLNPWHMLISLQLCVAANELFVDVQIHALDACFEPLHRCIPDLCLLKALQLLVHRHVFRLVFIKEAHCVLELDRHFSCFQILIVKMHCAVLNHLKVLKV